MKIVVHIFFIIVLAYPLVSLDDSNNVLGFIEEFQNKFSNYSAYGNTDSVKVIVLLQISDLKVPNSKESIYKVDTIKMYFYTNMKIMESPYISAYYDDKIAIDVDHQSKNIFFRKENAIRNLNAFPNIDFVKMKYEVIDSNKITFSQVFGISQTAVNSLHQGIYYFNQMNMTLDSARINIPQGKSVGTIYHKYIYYSLPMNNNFYQKIMNYIYTTENKLIDKYRNYKVVGKK